MNTPRTLSISVLLATLIGGAAAEGGLTREEVRAELTEAQLLGDRVVVEDSRTLAERNPERHAAIRAEHAARARQLAQTPGTSPKANR